MHTYTSCWLVQNNHHKVQEGVQTFYNSLFTPHTPIHTNNAVLQLTPTLCTLWHSIFLHYCFWDKCLLFKSVFSWTPIVKGWTYILKCIFWTFLGMLILQINMYPLLRKNVFLSSLSKKSSRHFNAIHRCTNVGNSMKVHSLQHLNEEIFRR